VTVSSDGEFSLVAMRPAPSVNEYDVNFDIFFKAYESSSSFNEKSVVSSISISEEDVVSSGLNVDDSMQGTQSNLPIVGHRLSGYGTDEILLDDSIDVLFYDGGDMRVEGFELGKDLLWFFLPEEAVVQADRQILEGGDLSLELEGVGNLTFVGLLNSDDNSFLL
jgi:hypothetical protein